MKAIVVASLLFPLVADAATRDFPIAWTHSLETIEGDSLDPNGDGIPELLGGYKLYTSDGVFVQAFPPTQSSATVRLNVPYGNQCFKMKAWHKLDGVEEESDWSNVGACREVKPGKPKNNAVK